MGLSHVLNVEFFPAVMFCKRVGGSPLAQRLDAHGVVAALEVRRQFVGEQLAVASLRAEENRDAVPGRRSQAPIVPLISGP